MAEVEKYLIIIFMWAHAVRCREDELKKLTAIVALPRGGSMPLRWPFN